MLFDTMADDDLLVDGHEGARTVVLAHGAGAPMDSPFMTHVAEALAAEGLRTVRFEFPYMQQRRRSGRRRGPDRGEVLAETWRAVIERLGGAGELVIGGKSLGGRIASMIADDVGARGLVCLGYPFHPPRKPEVLRVAHLRELETPTLVVQGTRDALGDRGEVRGYDLSPRIRVVWLEDGDHSFKPRVRSGRTERQNLGQAVEAVSEFILGL
jgi:predicted alpha/beta-hydrolase family hydrolase